LKITNRIDIEKLNAGEILTFSGEMIVMRDAAQKRISELLSKKEEIPVNLNNKIIFYAGPAKPPENSEIGAIGPTTSERMDKYLEMLFNLGVIATVGKGKRSNSAVEFCKNYKRAYFITPSGAAAYLSKTVEDIKIIAFSDLGTEAIHKIQVKNFPLMVGIDSKGDQIF
jgi:fumarate hydratase subunit beta